MLGFFGKDDGSSITIGRLRDVAECVDSEERCEVNKLWLCEGMSA